MSLTDTPVVTYYGKIYRHFFTRVAENVGITTLTGKRFKVSNNQQYLIIYLNKTVQYTLIILIFYPRRQQIQTSY